MGMDVRLPIGGMFAIVGLLLALYGLLTGNDAAVYARSLSVNINLWWGVVMFVFGLIMFVLSRRAATTSDEVQGARLASDSVEGRATERREHRLGLEREK